MVTATHGAERDAALYALYVGGRQGRGIGHFGAAHYQGGPAPQTPAPLTEVSENVGSLRAEVGWSAIANCRANVVAMLYRDTP